MVNYELPKTSVRVEGMPVQLAAHVSVGSLEKSPCNRRWYHSADSAPCYDNPKPRLDDVIDFTIAYSDEPILRYDGYVGETFPERERRCFCFLFVNHRQSPLKVALKDAIQNRGTSKVSMATVNCCVGMSGRLGPTTYKENPLQS
jgi:hypothetical protein